MQEFIYGNWAIVEAIRAGRRVCDQLILADGVEEKGTTAEILALAGGLVVAARVAVVVVDVERRFLAVGRAVDGVEEFVLAVGGRRLRVWAHRQALVKVIVLLDPIPWTAKLLVAACQLELKHVRVCA